MGINVVAKVLSDDASRATLEGLLDSARDHVRNQLGNHQYLIEALRDALLEREELIGVEITDVLIAAQAAHEASVVDLRDALPQMPASGTVQFKSDPSGQE
jgi:cell division protease FtsH